VVLALDWLATALSFPASVADRELAVFGFTEHESVLGAYGLVGLVELVLLIATWVVTASWLAAGYDNAAVLGRARMRRSKVWVWLGWVVPVVAFWFPKQIVEDVRDVTTEAVSPPGAGILPTNADESVRFPPATGWWWAAFLSADILNVIEARQKLIVPGLLLVSSVAYTVAFVFWIRLVRRLSQVQDQLATHGPRTTLPG